MSYPDKIDGEVRYLGFKAGLDLREQIDQIVAVLRRTRGVSYTRADWIREQLYAAVVREAQK